MDIVNFFNFLGSFIGFFVIIVKDVWYLKCIGLYISIFLIFLIFRYCVDVYVYLEIGCGFYNEIYFCVFVREFLFIN